MSEQLTALEAQVAANTVIQEAAVALIKAIHDKLVEAGTDQAKLTQLAADLKASDDKLEAAVAAATDPVVPPTEPPTEPPEAPSGSDEFGSALRRSRR